jgi:hypothetical protein
MRIFDYLGVNHPNLLLQSDATREVEHSLIESSGQLTISFRRPDSPWILLDSPFRHSTICSADFNQSFINQTYTWSRLEISEELLRKLFTRLRVHPDFLNVLHIFGEKVAPIEESYNYFFAHIHPEQTLHLSSQSNTLCSYGVPMPLPTCIVNSG